MIDITKFYDMNPAYVAVEPISPNADFKPEASKYELHSMGKVLRVSKQAEQYINIKSPKEPEFAMLPLEDDIIIYDATKSISVVESNGKLEFVPYNAIMAIKGGA